MKCPKCGVELEDNANFCKECGHKIIEEKPKESPKKDDNKKYIIIGVVIIVVAIIIGGAIFLSGNNNGIAGIGGSGSGNEKITNVNQGGWENSYTGGGTYIIDCKLTGLDEDTNYTIRATWYNSQGEAVLSQSQALNDFYTIDDGEIPYVTISGDSGNILENISNVTIELYDSNNNLITNYDYQWIASAWPEF